MASRRRCSYWCSSMPSSPRPSAAPTAMNDPTRASTRWSHSSSGDSPGVRCSEPARRPMSSAAACPVPGAPIMTGGCLVDGDHGLPATLLVLVLVDALLAASQRRADRDERPHAGIDAVVPQQLGGQPRRALLGTGATVDELGGGLR